MNGYFSRLRPAERRFVVAVVLLFFIVVNVFWIWPHFDDWGQLKGRLAKTRADLEKFQAAAAKVPKLQAEVKRLASEASDVPSGDQSIHFLRTIQMQAAQSGVNFSASTRSHTSTNQFFIEQLQTVTVAAGEKQLVDFLYKLGSSDSLVRVRELSVRPDPTRQQLNANITFVASFQRQEPPPRAGRGATSTRPATRERTPATPGGAAPKRS